MNFNTRGGRTTVAGSTTTGRATTIPASRASSARIQSASPAATSTYMPTFVIIHQASQIPSADGSAGWISLDLEMLSLTTQSPTPLLSSTDGLTPWELG